MCFSYFMGNQKLAMVAACLLALAGLFLPSSTNTTIKSIVKSKLVIKPGGVTYDFWKSNPVPIYYSFYMFNVTNPEEAKRGAKIRLDEVGPYVYRMQQNKENITFDPTAGTVGYEQNKVYTFVPHRSGTGLSPDDQINHLNYIIVAASEIIHNKFAPGVRSFTYGILADAYNKTGFDSSWFLSHKVSQLLFDGYDDKIIPIAKAIHINLPFDRFGFFASRNNVTGADGHYDVYTGEDDINKLGLLAKWNNSDHLGFYENESKCDTFDYSSAGDFQPPYQLKNNKDPIYMFFGDISRSFRMDYEKDVKFKDISCRRYTADSRLFNYEIEENKCYCMNNNGSIICPENGVANVSESSFGAPLFISFPHFLYTNQSYTKHLHGLYPDKAKHSFHFEIEPNLGIPMKVDAKMQLNFVAKPNHDFETMKDFPFDELVIPALWMTVGMELNDEMTDKLKLTLKTLPSVL